MQAQFNKPPERDPLNVEENVAAGRIFSKTERERFLARTIISFSGWRRVFAADKDEESRTAEISPLSALFTAAAAAAAARRLKKRLGREPVTIAVAMDTRPTGSGIAFNVIRALLAERARVHWLSVAPTPEALSYTAGTEEVDGLIYVTASHNPVGHNGLKFAAADGGVIAPGENERLKGEFLNIFNSQEQLEELRQRILAASSGEIEAVYSQVERHKSSALRLYREFTSRVFTAHDQALEASSLLEKLRQRILERPIGLVAEFNGSARTCSIDVDFFRSLGVKLKVINGQPGRIKHAILPEGEALLPCCRALEKAASRDPSFELGYVPDCDGDRGNVVLLDQTGRAHPLQAQEVFALAVVSELSFLASF
ncbi:MAG TPA: phosphatidylglycerol lysyltransferase, partial [archaeon]|nr:phosphatidylglycerol lysyltransferase [archaeon]